MNSFLNNLEKETNYTLTENGGVAHKSTLNALYDLFAFGGAYRNRTDEDCIVLFKSALEEDEALAMKCLFYLRDIKGQGERRFFRVCYNWLAKNYPEIAFRNIDSIPELGRWDDLYCLEDTQLESDAFDFIQSQILKDKLSLQEKKKSVSLLGKWLKSENASSAETRRLAEKTRKYLKLSHKDYRKLLSSLRERINIVEKLISANRWNEIKYDTVPSKAGLIYSNAFAMRDYDRYNDFISNKETKIKTQTLYPYEIVKRAIRITRGDKTQREALEKMWKQQVDYVNGKNSKTLCVVDTSGSMRGTPINVAISLGMYFAENIEGAFKNHYISFSSRPQLIKINGADFCDKVRRIYDTNLCQNTDIHAVFDLLKNSYLSKEVSKEDLPENIIIISDMEIDCGSHWRTKQQRLTEMESIRAEWESLGLKLPHLIYWNVDARNNIILDNADRNDVSFVSGFSPSIFETILTGKTGKDLMLEKLNNKRYERIF